jgi:CBS domain-containing protein
MAQEEGRLNMQIGEVCTREVYIVRADEPLPVAVREMNNRHIGAVVVVESGGDVIRPVGITTDRDIVRGLVDRRADLSSLTVGDVMTKNPLTLLETSSVAQGIERLSARGVRRAPVVSEGGDLVGIVTFDDLLPVLAEELTALAKLVGTQATRESSH